MVNPCAMERIFCCARSVVDLFPVENQQLVQRLQHVRHVHKIVLELLSGFSHAVRVGLDVPLALGLVKEVVAVPIPELRIQMRQRLINGVLRGSSWSGTPRWWGCPSSTEWPPQSAPPPTCQTAASLHQASGT